jgi:hypothetical protein
VREDVAARDIHLPVEHHGDGMPGGGGFERAVERHDLGDARLDPVRPRDDRIADGDRARATRPR